MAGKLNPFSWLWSAGRSLFGRGGKESAQEASEKVANAAAAQAMQNSARAAGRELSDAELQRIGTLAAAEATKKGPLSKLGNWLTGITGIGVVGGGGLLATEALTAKPVGTDAADGSTVYQGAVGGAIESLGRSFGGAQGGMNEEQEKREAYGRGAGTASWWAGFTGMNPQGLQDFFGGILKAVANWIADLFGMKRPALAATPTTPGAETPADENTNTAGGTAPGLTPGLGLTGPAASEPGIIDSTINYVEEFGNNVTGVFTGEDDASYYDNGMVFLRSTGTRLSGWGGSAVGWAGGQLADTYNSTFGNPEAEDLSTKWSDELSAGAEGLATQFYDASDAVQSYVAHDLLGFDELSSVPDTDRERAIAGVGSVAADALAFGGGGAGLIRGGVALGKTALNAFRAVAPAPSATSNANVAGTTARVSGGNAQSIPLEAAAGPAM